MRKKKQISNLRNIKNTITITKKQPIIRNKLLKNPNNKTRVIRYTKKLPNWKMRKLIRKYRYK